MEKGSNAIGILTKGNGSSASGALVNGSTMQRVRWLSGTQCHGALVTIWLHCVPPQTSCWEPYHQQVKFLPCLPLLLSPVGPYIPLATMSNTTNSTATSLKSLLLPHLEAFKERNIFIGDGLPSIPPKLYRRMLNWSYIDMAELQPLGSIKCQNPEPDPAHYVILPGLELAKANKKVVLDIHTWIHCFAIYLTVMATKQPTVLP